jgi:gliding motility-associated-like protein
VSGTYNHFDTTYSFNTAGSINTQLLITSFGYTGNCVDSIQKTIEVIAVSAGTDTSICLGDTLFLSATGATTYTWDNNLGVGQNQIATPIIDTVFVVSGNGPIGCTSTDTVAVKINALPVVEASSDLALCLGVDAIISATGAVSYSWDNELGSGETHTVSPEEATTYMVTGIDTNGCANKDSVIITIEDMCFEVPNVFTPNGDGKNDVWNIHGLETYPDLTVKVFNRWGDSVFESDKGYTEPWDGTYNGTDSPSATYYFIIVLGDGEDGISGTVNIVR